MSAPRPSVTLRWGRVLALGQAREGAIELVVDDAGLERSALAYPDLVGAVDVDDRVLLNVTAVELGLGTGGFDLVVAVDRETDAPSKPGRMMKARYTPLQVAVTTIEETHRDTLEAARGLDGVPVVVAPLHSMLAPIAAGARAAGAERIAYVMTDGAALPGPFSRLVPRLRDAGLLDGWITAGQAFGGELEAVTVWTALLAAVHIVRADVVVVADGPGNLGTDTTWGVSALELGTAANAAETLGGRAVVALRVSFTDARERHRVVSHHSLTMLERVVGPGAHVAVPVLEEPSRTQVWDALRSRRLEERHQLVETDGGPAVAELERRSVAVESMGRAPTDDPAFFLAAGAAGVLAARMAAGSRAWRRDAT
jgi:Protein of unknown function (DUF3866)